MNICPVSSHWGGLRRGKKNFMLQNLQQKLKKEYELQHSRYPYTTTKFQAQVSRLKTQHSKFNILNSILIVLIIISAFAVPLFKVDADPIADPNDIFNVNSPGPNQKVSGTINISWRMFDNQQSSIQYSVNLLDGATCKNVNYGALNSSSIGTSSSTKDNVLQWNTTTTLTNPNLADGKYCIQICGAFLNGTTPYSACNSRNVSVVNHNSLPKITSVPTNLTIKENDSFQYQIKAVDPDNDPLKYLLVMSPNFLSINSSGLVQTNSVSKALAAGVASAAYKIIVGVDDGISGTTTQEFTLTIISSNPTPATTTTTGTTGTGTTTTTPTNSPTDITIILPTDTSVFSSTSNKIQWVSKDTDGISQTKLSYSADLKTWTDIISLSDPSVGSYLWDVSKIPDGTYYLQITVTDMKNAVVSKTSKAFEIQNNQVTQQNPVITNVVPANLAVINDSTPEISGALVPPSGRVIDLSSFKLLVDDTDLTTTCVFENNAFKCQLIDELGEGKHQISIFIKDSTTASANYVSTFTINLGGIPTSFPASFPSSFPASYSVGPITITGDSIIIFGQTIPKNVALIAGLLLVLCCLLLFIPWLLFTLWSGRSKHTQQTTTTTTSVLEPQPVTDINDLQSYSQQYPALASTTSTTYTAPTYTEPAYIPEVNVTETKSVATPVAQPLPPVEPTAPDIQSAYSQNTTSDFSAYLPPVEPAPIPEPTPVVETTTSNVETTPVTPLASSVPEPATTTTKTTTTTQNLQPLQPNQDVDPNAFLNYDWYQPLPPITETTSTTTTPATPAAPQT